MLHTMGSKKISEAKTFASLYCGMNKNLITMFAEKKIVLEKVALNSVFHHLQMDFNPDHFNCQVDKQKCKDYPVILYYHKNLK